MSGTSLLHNAINAHDEVNSNLDIGSNADSGADHTIQLRKIIVFTHPGSGQGYAAGEQENHQNHEHDGDNLQETASDIVAGKENAHI